MIRLTIWLLLGILVLGLIMRGLRWLWQTTNPKDGELAAEPEPGWLTSRTGKAILWLLVFLILLMVVDHLLDTQGPPLHAYEPPHMENGRIIPSRIY